MFSPDETHLVSYALPRFRELAIAVELDRIGQGAGSFLVNRLLSEADRSGIPAIVLFARADNPAVRLSERFGFVEVDRIVNSVGASSVEMVRESSP